LPSPAGIASTGQVRSAPLFAPVVVIQATGRPASQDENVARPRVSLKTALSITWSVRA
jgi:hypothetical protein